MPFFIDRRRNPKDKSLGNRQRFMRRARARIKEVVNNSVKGRSVTDLGNGETVSIPTKGIDEPHFRHAQDGGKRQRVYTGNKEFLTGDKLPKPPGGGAGGKEASDAGEGEDEFRFVLSREEFLDLFFEDLELPDLVKTGLREVYSTKLQHAGLSVAGTPTNLNLLRTMRNSYGRRIALKRPGNEAVEAIQAEILELEAKTPATPEQQTRLKALHDELEALEAISATTISWRSPSRTPRR